MTEKPVLGKSDNQPILLDYGSQKTTKNTSNNRWPCSWRSGATFDRNGTPPKWGGIKSGCITARRYALSFFRGT